MTHKPDSRDPMYILADVFPHIIWIVSPTGRIVYCNKEWYDYTGYNPSQTPTKQTWRSFIHPADRLSYARAVQKTVSTRRPQEIEFRIKSKSGEYQWFLGKKMPMRGSKGKILYWVGTCTNIESQKQAFQSLKESEERFKSLFDSNIVGIVISDLDEKILDTNDVFLNMLGYNRAEVLSGNISWSTLTPKEYDELDRTQVQAVIDEGKVAPFEKEFLHKDGRRVPVLVGAALLNPASPSPHGPRAVNFILDITEQKAQEQRKDDFIRMAGHELKTPLTNVKIFAEMFKEQMAEADEPTKTVIVKMNNQINKLSSLIDELLDITKIERGELELKDEWFDLDALVQGVVETFKHTGIKHAIIVSGSIGVPVKGDRERIEQVLTNLIVNAIKYSPKAEKVEIELSKSKRHVILKVRDWGIGIPPEHHAHIFQRFYRASDSSPSFPGLGMGLYISSEITKRHGGVIRLKSAPGEGSTFSVFLPLSAPLPTLSPYVKNPHH